MSKREVGGKLGMKGNRTKWIKWEREWENKKMKGEINVLDKRERKKDDWIKNSRKREKPEWEWEWGVIQK